MISAQKAADRIIRAIVDGRREAFFPWYQSGVMAGLRHPPPFLYDGLMVAIGRWGMKGEY
ncbi:MAG: hypothetical protein HY650_14655 [Acidobacteria bacterium]|nr:hypothetical protein [Acidobacteriota bacterium]